MRPSRWQSAVRLCSVEMLLVKQGKMQFNADGVYLGKQLIVALGVQALIVEEGAVCGSQVHDVWPHLALCEASLIFVSQPAAKKRVSELDCMSDSTGLSCKGCRLCGVSTKGHFQGVLQTPHLYCRMACCLLQDGWSVGMSATRRSRPKK